MTCPKRLSSDCGNCMTRVGPHPADRDSYWPARPPVFSVAINFPSWVLSVVTRAQVVAESAVMRTWAKSIGCWMSALLAAGLVAVGWAQQPSGRLPSPDKAQQDPATVQQF